jgi:hypothetical protein
MLNQEGDESSGVTTLELARGNVSTTIAPRSTIIAESRASLERGGSDARNKQTGLQFLRNIDITELLEQDERPTFIIDVENSANFSPGGPLHIVFSNASLRAHPIILEMVTGKPDWDSPGIIITNNFPEFKAWVLSFVKNNESLDICLPSFIYEGMTWTCYTLRKRLRLIRGTSNALGIGTGSSPSNVSGTSSSVLTGRTCGKASKNSLTPMIHDLTEPSDYFGNGATRPSSIGETPVPSLSSPATIDSVLSPLRQEVVPTQSDRLTSEMLSTLYPEGSNLDWTRLPMSAALPRHIQFARSINWAATPLGPIDTWSFDLRAMCNLIMASPHPAAIYWGNEYIVIYNEAYILLAGQKHPALMVRANRTLVLLYI